MKEIYFAVTDYLDTFGARQPFWGANFLLMKVGLRLLGPVTLDTEESQQ